MTAITAQLLRLDCCRTRPAKLAVRHVAAVPCCSGYLLPGRAFLSDRAQHIVNPAPGIERAPEIIGLLRCSVIGVPEDGLGDTYVRWVADRHLGRNDLTKKMRVYSLTELALSDRAYPLAHFLRCQRPPIVADPESIP